MSRDSKTRGYHFKFKSRVVKSKIENGSDMGMAWFFMSDGLGCEFKLPVLELPPERSAALTCRDRVLLTTCLDVHCAQRDLYATE